MRARYIGIASLLALLLASLSTETAARKVEQQFAGRVVVLKRRAPPHFRSQGSFAQFLTRNRLKTLMPKSGEEGDQWPIEFMAFFEQPLKDVQVKVRFYDITEGRRFVAQDDIYHSARGQRILSSSLVLQEPEFRGNRQYVMYVLNSRNVVLAQTRLSLVGKRKSYSGRVDFSDEDVARP